MRVESGDRGEYFTSDRMEITTFALRFLRFAPAFGLSKECEGQLIPHLPL